MITRIFLFIFLILAAHSPGKPFYINKEEDKKTVNTDREIYIS